MKGVEKALNEKLKIEATNLYVHTAKFRNLGRLNTRFEWFLEIVEAREKQLP